MTKASKIKDRQVGRNAELFARSIGEMETIEERYPYIRILISIVEQAHPELNQAPNKDTKIATLVVGLSGGGVDPAEIADIVRVRDEERGYYYEKPKESAKEPKQEETKDVAADEANEGSAVDAKEESAEDANEGAEDSTEDSKDS